MSDFDRPTSALYERPTPRRRQPSAGTRLGDRLARTFAGLQNAARHELPEHAEVAEAPEWEGDGDYEYTVEDHTQPLWEFEDGPDRYPRIRNGYDPIAVDRHVVELEREIDGLRGRQQPSQAVAEEIEKIGEQTSSILLMAHEQAQAIKREAQQQADRCLGDAAANAVKMTEDAKRKLSQLDTETDTVWQERSRLLQDARTVATALISLVDDASERFPAEPEKSPPVVGPVAAIEPQAAGPAGETPAERSAQ